MADLSVQRTPHLTITPTSADGQRQREPQERRERSPEQRQRAIAALLQAQGITADEEAALALQVVTDPASGATRVRVWDQDKGELLLDLPAEEFADAATAHQLFEGLLVERSS
ncbi:MAG: hypothetical protein V3V06_07545 [Dehalococcoidia bacterium]